MTKSPHARSAAEPRRRRPLLRGRRVAVGLRGRLLSTLLVAVVSTVSLTAVGVQQMARQAELTRAAYLTGTVPLDALRTLQGTWWEFQAHNAEARATGATPDEVAAARQSAERLRQVLDGQGSVVRTSGLSPAVREPYEEFRTSSEDYLASDASRRGEAGVSPSTEELASGSRAAQAASDALERATALQVQAAAETSLDAREDFVHARRSTLALMLTGLAATLLVTAAMTASIMRPLAQIRRSLASVATGPRTSGRRADDLLRGLAEDIATVQHSRELVRRTVEALPSPVLRVDGTGRVVFANSQARRLLHVVEGAGPREQAASMAAADAAEYVAVLAQTVGGTDARPRRLQVLVPADGSPGAAGATQERAREAGAARHLTAVFVPLGDLGGTSGATVSFTDDTEAVVRHEAMRRRAETDGLTGCLNRAALVEHLGGLLARRTELSVVFVDLDRFKPINDDFGHATGDLVLRAVADAISGTLRPQDVVGRVGGDEFVVLLLGRMPDLAREAVVRRMRTAIARPVLVDGAAHTVGASMGAVSAGCDETADAVLARADAAMYEDKRTRAGDTSPDRSIRSLGPSAERHPGPAAQGRPATANARPV